MRVLFLQLVCVLVFTLHAQGQGELFFYNGMVPTRIGSFDGPLAGSEYWGQMLVGATSDALLPVGTAVPHRRAGVLNGGIITVDGVPCRTSAYTQLVAWDGNLWGTSLAQVPPDQLGRTDTVLTYFECDPLFPSFAPMFSPPAIVPIPEPSVLALGLVAGGFLALHSCWRHGRRKATKST